MHNVTSENAFKCQSKFGLPKPGLLSFVAVACILFAPLLTSCSNTALPGSERRITGTIKGHGDSEAREMKIWFVKPINDQISLVPVLRTLSGSDQLAEAVQQLLSGPTSTESDAGLSSEIPKGTTLLGVKRTDGDVELNLSKDFASSGGGMSLETRIEQLSRTVSTIAGSQKVYLAIEGERLSSTAGDGLEIKQPIND